MKFCRCLVGEYLPKNYSIIFLSSFLFQVKDGTTDALYQLIVTFFQKNNIPFERNMVGFASDGASVMMAAENSVAAKFKLKIPNIFILKCICHSLALAVSYAVRALPSHLEQFMSDVYCYLKYSHKRQLALGQLQQLLDIPEHKILKMMKVRWLSLSSAVSRYIEQYDALFHFFKAESHNPKNTEAKSIFEQLRNRFTLLYLHFLNFILPVVCKRNLEFQSISPKIHTLHKKMETLLKSVARCYMKEDYVDSTDAEFLNVVTRTKETEQFWEPLHRVDLGPTVTAELASLPSSITAAEINTFRSNCRQFLISLAEQICRRFPFADKSTKLLKALDFIEPINLKDRRNIAEVSSFFGFNTENVHAEFRVMKNMFKNDLEADPDVFWKKVKSVQHADGSPEFPLINEIVENVTVLPHTSADCERNFSDINLNKTKIRNCLGTDTVTGIMHGKALIKNCGVGNVTSIDCKPMLQLFNQNMYITHT